MCRLTYTWTCESYAFKCSRRGFRSMRVANKPLGVKCRRSKDTVSSHLRVMTDTISQYAERHNFSRATFYNTYITSYNYNRGIPSACVTHLRALVYILYS